MSVCFIVPDINISNKAEAPSLVPNPAIDLTRLSAFAGGDAGTMHELLRLFACEIDMLIARMSSEEPREAAARAHTLAAAARTLGVWHVADTATAFEDAALQSGPIALAGAMNRLSRAATDAQAEIASLTAGGESATATSRPLKKEF